MVDKRAAKADVALVLIAVAQQSLVLLPDVVLGQTYFAAESLEPKVNLNSLISAMRFTNSAKSDQLIVTKVPTYFDTPIRKSQ